jgi:transcription elongation factor GreA
MPTPITKKGYDALKSELDRLRKIERPKVIEAIAEARVVETAGRTTETVVFGATVLVVEQESQSRKQYTLVGQDEADMKFNKISVQSPVGRALIGKRVGDFVEVKTPVKLVEYEVVEIKFEEF